MNRFRTNKINGQHDINAYVSLIKLNIINELKYCLKDLDKKNNTISSLSTKYKTKHMLKGGSIENIKRGISFVKDRNDTDMQKEKMLIVKLQKFKTHINDVISSINQINQNSDSGITDIKTLARIKREYDEFNRHVNLLTQKGTLGKTEESPDSDTNVFISSLYNMWIPFVTDHEKLLKSVDATDTEVMQILQSQCKDNIHTLDMFNNILDVIMYKVRSSIVETPEIQYRLSHRPRESSSLYTIMFYEKYDIVNRQDVNVQEGSISFIKNSVYDFMKDIDTKHSDSMSLIETDKIKLIQDFATHVGRYFNIKDLNIDMRANTNICNEQILDLFSATEKRSFLNDRDLATNDRATDDQTVKDRATDDQTVKDGATYDQTTIDQIANDHKHAGGGLSDSILTMTSMISDINTKLGKISNQLKVVTLKKKQIRSYVLYLMRTASLKGVNHLNIYKYINRGVLEFYLNILRDIQNRISKKEQPDDAVYFDTYHHYTMRRIMNFLLFLSSNMTISDLIDIDKCTGRILSDFVLFNHFKEILESYHESMQNRVSIYARINDYGDMLPEKQNRLFAKDTRMPGHIRVTPQTCPLLSDRTVSGLIAPKSVKFNMVFDSDEFKSNEDISMYMCISANISKKKGVSLITYGYSGTGKTFTLFGDGKSKGLLQSAMEGIASKNEIYFRVYEMYGAGVKYPFYWCDSVTESCYIYRINPHTNKIDDVIQTDVDTIISRTTENVDYIIIDKQNVIKFFKNFNTLVNEIDKIREIKGRIKKTPNNPKSSRSIIIYDMMIRVDKELVRFTIIDLPGREEIVQTYTQDYINTHLEFNTPFHKAVLSSMSIDPLYLAVLCPVTIINAFNNLDRKLRKYILTQPLSIDDLDSCIDLKNMCLSNIDVNTSAKDTEYKNNGKQENAKDTQNENVKLTDNMGVSFANEPVLVLKILGKRKMDELIDIDSKTSQIKMMPNLHHDEKDNVSDTHKIHIKFETSGWKNNRHIDLNITTIQYQAVIAIHMLNRIILLKDSKSYNKFDVLEHIYRAICVKFRYNDYDEFFRAPFEGVYINENIVGLLKIISTDSDLLNKSLADTMKMISPQKNISFKDTKRLIRENNKSLYINIDAVAESSDTQKFENIGMNNTILTKIYEENKRNYSSQKIFLICNPLIEKVIKYYIKDTTMPYINLGEKNEDHTLAVRGIKDVKIFYLFSNVNQELKCVHQYKLFENTIGLINLVDNAII